jgi:hypothetical protein
MERDELNTGWSGAILESSVLCLEALGNEAFFSPCQGMQSDTEASSCGQLALRVCGEGDACGETQRCRLARQLVVMEQQDRLNTPQTPSPASGQCREALEQSNAFFQPCDP